MKNSSIRAGVTAAVAAFLGASLTGCGGGMAEDSGPIGAPPSAMYKSFNEVAEYCGISDRLPTAEGARPSFIVPYSTARRYSWSSEYTSVVLAANGWRPDETLATATLHIPFRDYRSSTPVVNWVDAGFVTEENGKGVQLFLEIPPGGIACVAPAAWLLPHHTENYYNESLHQNVPIHYRMISWESRERTPLPVETLPGYPVDAFEMVGNYTPRSGRAFFSTIKTSVADQGAIQMCHLPVGSDTWNCKVPKVTDQGTAWFFTLDGAAPGAYVLVSAHAGARQ